MTKIITILIILLGATGIYVATKEPPIGGIASLVSAKEIDGVEMTIDYTDDNTGEDLIISTDKSDYFNFGGNITTYFSIYNKVETQDVTIAFSFKGEHQPTVYEYAGETITKGYEIKHATSTEYVATTTQTIWNELSQEDFNKVDLTDIKETQTLKQNTVSMTKGETKFFKATIYGVPSGREEFFIQAWGSKSAVGILQ